MVIYGMFFGAHQYSTTLIKDGKILYAVENERITRVKHGYSWFESPKASYVAIEKATGIKFEDVDYIAISDPGQFRYDLSSYNNSPDKVANYYFFKQKLKVFDKPIILFEHHQCHAAAGYYLAGFHAKTVIVTMDGGSNERNYSTVWLGENGDMTKVHQNLEPLEGSLGCIWFELCKHFGYTPVKDEGKIMGLAPQGKLNQDFYNILDEVCKYQGNLRFSTPHNFPLAGWAFKQCEGNGFFDTHEKRADIAFTTQKHFEDQIIPYIKDIKARYPQHTKLVLSGGIFANVKANQRINEECGFEEIFIAPPMGDEGLSLGAAMLASYKLGEWKHQPTKDVFFGFEYTDEQVMDAALKFNVKAKGRYTNDMEFVVSELTNRKVFGIFNGRFELGPRALGNRSVIMEATNRYNHSHLNQRFERDETMPFAPIVLNEKADEVFDIKSSKFASEFMTLCHNVKEEWKEKIPAVTHLDGTARPQIVNVSSHPVFYNILYHYDKWTNIPVLINTSFNGHGEPIIDTPEQAFAHLEKGSIDYLIINNMLYVAN
jgi:carbamoyltransferase